MDKLAEKINMLIALNRVRYALDKISEVEVVNFLWSWDCIRDRVINRSALHSKLREIKGATNE